MNVREMLRLPGRLWRKWRKRMTGDDRLFWGNRELSRRWIDPDNLHVYPLDEEDLHYLVGVRCRCQPKFERKPTWGKGVISHRRITHARI